MRGHGFPWSKLLMVLLVFAAGFIAHDIRSHGSVRGSSERYVFKTSRLSYPAVYLRLVLCLDSATAMYLHTSGVTPVSQQAWGKITVYSKQGFRYDFKF